MTYSPKCRFCKVEISREQAQYSRGFCHKCRARQSRYMQQLTPEIAQAVINLTAKRAEIRKRIFAQNQAKAARKPA